MTRDDVARQIADELIRIAGATIAERGRFTLAVPGGSVADVVLPLLAAAPIDWRPVDLFLADDRVVDPKSPESNERLVRELLIEPLGPAAPTFHPLVTPGVALAEAAARAERDLTTTVGTPPRLDLVLLGVGEDGHVASLFPGHAALRDSAWVVPVEDAPKPPPTRLSLGLETLATARRIWLAAFGAAKAPVVAELRGNPASQLPAAIVAARASDIRWWLDAGAGG